MQPVWILSVDLQTKTATFQSGMADAAKSARGAFSEISHGSKGMGEDVAHASIDVRHSLGLVDNVIRGAHAQAMADLVRLWAQSAIVMATLPIAAAAAGLALIGGVAYEAYEKIKQLHEGEEKLADDMLKFETSVNGAFRALDDRMLEAEQKSDELRNDHLGALHTQLELLNNQSFDELVHSFGLVSKAADIVFADLAGKWYTLGIGSDGAKHALAEFQTQYENLLSQGKAGEASDLLAGTLEGAKKVLAIQLEAKANGGGLVSAPNDNADIGLGLVDQARLNKLGVGYNTQNEIDAQRQLVEALSKQVMIEQKVADLKKQEAANDTRSVGNEQAAKQAAAARASIESQLRMGASAIAGDRATAEARLSIQRASVEARLQNDLDFANRDFQMKMTGNQLEIAALDKSGKDYQNQVKALNEKTLEITQQHETEVETLKAKASVEAARRDLTDMEARERQKIDATKQGSAERLAAVDAAIKEEQSKNLQDTSYYRELLDQRVELARKAAEDEAKDKADAGKESAENIEKMGELAVAAEKEKNALADSARRVTDAMRMQQELKAANDEFAIKQTALNREIAALDKSGKDYESKLKQIQDKQKQLVQQHEDEVTAIKDKAEIARNSRLVAEEQRFNDQVAAGLTQSIMGHETWTKMLINFGNQAVSATIENAMKFASADEMDRQKDAAKAARKMFLAGAHFPFPTNIVMAPVLGAAAYATMMAFEKGTDRVPGVGHGDTVPAMLTPGEGVVPGGVMDGLRSMARSGNMGGGNHYTVHVRPTYNVQSLDSGGMDRVLEKHTDLLQKHFEGALRKMNK